MPLKQMEYVVNGPRYYCDDTDVSCSTGKTELGELLQEGPLSLRMAILVKPRVKDA